MPAIDQTDLLRRAEAAYVELFRAMARVSPEGAIEENDGLLFTATGADLPFFSAAFLLAPPVDPAAVLAWARAFFRGRVERFVLDVCYAAGDGATAAIDALAPGFEPSDCMLLAPLAPLAPLVGGGPVVPGLEIRAVESVGDLRTYNDTMTAGFGGPLAWAAETMLRDDTLLSVPDLTHYIGLLDGMPVATAMRFSSQRVALIANVSTIPEYRRRGIGEAMTWRAVLGGVAEGCIAAYLQASEMGKPIYQRMGFRHFFTHPRWMVTVD